jgi:F-type H+-transporting ATPase subunit b
MFDAPFWALVALILFFAVVIYLKVPGTLARSLDTRA